MMEKKSIFFFDLGGNLLDIHRHRHRYRQFLCNVKVNWVL